MSLDADELNPTDRAILDELQGGRVTPAYVADEHSYTAGNVRNRMTSLAKHNHVRPVGGGLYELADDPRGGDTDDDPDLRDAAVDTDALRRALDDIEAACERGDGSAVQNAIRRARKELDDE
ncbi:hypothetical protein [Halostella pelagica]|uniref:hypothetical protein n=1 Tax=Halostella pelagica TaxID=2583824 RepID=UPI00192A650F|nr:hypothetical protein [Halostella pelagica]